MHRKDIWNIELRFCLEIELQMVLIFFFVLLCSFYFPQEVSIPCAIFLQVSV